jgi:hypothetical protein
VWDDKKDPTMIDEGEKNGWPHIMNLDLCDMGLFFVAKC